MTSGGRFDFDDGGTFCGGWEDGKAHGLGVCTGPKGQGEYAGAWHCGFEISGVYIWTSGNNYRGQWTQGKRHGVGVETKGRWVYQGEWTQGFKGRYGARHSTATGAKYEGTWTTGLQDGYGVETYADGGTYQGQWLRGIRHGYGLRQSVPYGLAAHSRQKGGRRESLTSLRSEQEEDHVVKDRDRKIDEGRGGFVLTGRRADDPPASTIDKRRSGSAEKPRSGLRKAITDTLRLRKQRSTGDIQDVTAAGKRGILAAGTPGATGSLRSTVSSLSQASSFGSSQSGVASMLTGSNASFVSQDDLDDVSMVESYSGEWKNDRRSGFGISERSDGLKYEGEWENNRKHGYGATTFRDGTREEGKYKNNVLISSGKRSKLFILRTSKLKDRVDNAVLAAQRAAQIALQKSDIAISRMTSARAKADLAAQAATKAQTDADKARSKATEYAPDLFALHPHTGSDSGGKKELHAESTKAALLLANHFSPSSSLPEHPPQTHAGPLTQASSAKSSLLPHRHHNVASIASALVSIGLEGSAHVVRNASTEGGSGGGAGQPPPFQNTAAPPPNRNGADPAGESRFQSTHSNVVSFTDSNPGSPADPNRFSALLTPTVIDDHFDQYKVQSPPPPPPSSGPRGNPTAPARFLQTGMAESDGTTQGSCNDLSPDSGVSVGDGDNNNNNNNNNGGQSRGGGGGGVGGPLVLHRRKTLAGAHGLLPPSATPSSAGSGNPTVTITPHRPKENGIGPAAASRDSTTTTTTTTTPGLNPGRQIPLHIPAVAMFRSTLRKSPNMGSMPDVSDGGAAAAPGGVMPREEVHLLSLRRREEMRREREEEERRRQQEIVLRFGDIKDWCRQRQLLVLVLAVNISLATVFFNLLAQ